MSAQYDLVVIGAGASGYAAAITAADKGVKVCLLDVGAKTARKVAASGNGRCNLSNLDVSAERYVTKDPELLADILADSDGVVRGFFARLGVLISPDEAGRLYPWSNRASSVVEALALAAQEKGVDLLVKAVTGLTPVKDGYLIEGEEGSIFARQVVLAVGTPASPQAGGRDNPWLDRLRLDSVPYQPALVALTVDKQYFSLKGVRAKAVATLTDDGKILRKEAGEILFGQGTLSGICAMQLSLFLPFSVHPVVSLDLLPDLTEEALAAMLSARASLTADKLFVGLLDKPIAYALLKEEGIPLNRDTHTLKSQDFAALARRAKLWSFTVTGTTGWDNAQVALGGVRLSQLTVSLESKRYKGLYFVGELVDVTGECGGYNLHWAWLSGIKAANRAVANCHLT